MATSAAERRTTVKAVPRKVAPSNGLADLFFELVDSLKAQEAQRSALLTRLRAEVERGDRMLADLGIERPSKTR
jgi:hypothetical protein